MNSSERNKDRACEHCAAFFIARRSDQRFCSDRCRLHHWRLQKSATNAAAEERSSIASHTQTIRKILLGLMDASPRTVVAGQLRAAFAELAKLDQAILRLQRQNDVPETSDLAADAPPEDRGTPC
ncbi:hypothetical protein [Kribbella kalugense]|uniref:hypothetical protein n=1 Tax=Kribbella kalugense TaxID=2512221 RepID=UPI001065E785|nr:hypothetical protein [Kribbella kalugense]